MVEMKDFSQSVTVMTDLFVDETQEFVPFITGKDMKLCKIIPIGNIPDQNSVCRALTIYKIVIKDIPFLIYSMQTKNTF